MEFQLADLFEAAADHHPDRLALVAGGERRTFRELDERATRFANHLRGAGIDRDHHVGIHAYNRAEWLEAMLACFKLGAVPINVNYRYVADELRYLYDDADLVGLVVERAFAPLASAARPAALHHVVVLEDGSDGEVPDDALSYERVLAAAPAERDFPGRSADDRYVVYTGGTTGAPKGVVWRHEDVYQALGGGIDPATGEKAQTPEDALRRVRENATPLVMFPLAPLMHLSGQWGALSRLFQGNTTVLWCGRSFDAEAVWRICAEEKVNVLLMSGDAMAVPLVSELERNRDAYDLSSLYSVASGAAVFSPSVKQRFRAQLPNAFVTDSVGSSEGGFNGTMLVGEDPSGDGPRIAPQADTAVLRPGTWERAAPGEVGKLARSGNVPLGYHNDPEKTAGTFVEADGRRWVVPGDDARVEEDGTITLLGRGSTCINTGGEKVFPEEVEAAVKSHPGVYDCVVVGVPDERWGQRVVVVAQPVAGARPTLDDVRSHCRDRLAGYKIPRELHLVDALERHPTGKPDYPWARRVATEAS